MWLAFFAGIFLGCFVGVLGLGLCIAFKNSGMPDPPETGPCEEWRREKGF